jgi:glycosyltransferase involved in cell wall biosynthesis
VYKSQQGMTDLTVVILTFNEEIHIRRVIENAWTVASDVLIVDSFSTDRTIELAKQLNARVLQNKFIHQAQQFQWAMENAGITTTWLLRMDADEYLTPELIEEINTRTLSLPTDISGIIFKRRVHFMGRWMKHGGYYPVKLLRMWKTGHARIEQRWMDEHTYLTQGKAIEFQYDLVDDNLNNLAWWTEKHNTYSTREAIEILSTILANRDMKTYHEIDAFSENQAARKRWYKQNVYLRLPLFVRCFFYYQYRYWLKLGFLDGKQGFIFHFLQAFWYRFLVDAKLYQMQRWAKMQDKPLAEIIKEKYKIDLKAI